MTLRTTVGIPAISQQHLTSPIPVIHGSGQPLQVCIGVIGSPQPVVTLYKRNVSRLVATEAKYDHNSGCLDVGGLSSEESGSFQIKASNCFGSDKVEFDLEVKCKET